MRKSELIQLLETIEGNPEIVLWNGLVGDYMHIDPTPVEGTLVKETPESYIETCRLRECVERKDRNYQFSEAEAEELAKIAKGFEWELNQLVTEDDVRLGRYQERQVVFLNAQLRNKTHIDRLGAVEY